MSRGGAATPVGIRQVEFADTHRGRGHFRWLYFIQPSSAMAWRSRSCVCLPGTIPKGREAAKHQKPPDLNALRTHLSRRHAHRSAHEPRRYRQSCSGSDVAKPCLHTGKQVRLFAMRATQRGDGAWQRSSLRLGQCQYRLHSGKHGHRTTVACKEDLVGAPTRRWATLSVVRQLLLDALRRRTATNSLGGAIEDLRLVCARPQFQIVEPSPVDARSLDLRSHSKPVLAWGMTRLSRLP